ncbi:undecaprenyl/decaprenyl-phosphate alpha-N-acetylglucosaminyl 1-phosphate transferase [Mesorhizobium captivum]|uniref:undecaprenyl/decaprenyl-phosphate alpha-N-acetylglucosaminyl 1-phosphate transferase n=1 Tax=Mesorhizobium captivum TaxID=3072319 RepID=UPI002A249080|nr:MULTISPECIES: undecaprenyl/decaprenyl-phosphate alpha-N-acetylglucosaminyl 1-phosphate transferase [unclassified Mesorhizobium]MDX8502181.1 undecaprenyl/decaprenyl-phosphate alpha-N-acetylglucosaminyl 1-phosphate transferase [Mesorhizobium sp. VK4C]MDX8513973.1 undecaprenyl/decaprenyl-phosphate alpha-N-acetylglucosaminyl 1-phosphate transferase [Mesorhizobium sp. VK23E]
MTLGPLVPLIGALLIAVPCVWLLARLATRIGAVSKVKSDRWHTSGEVPRLAGPALLIAMSPWLAAGQIFLLAIFCLVGALDDVRSLSAEAKAAALAVAAILAGIITGVWWVPIVIWIACNAVNMLDHADGLAASAVAAAFLGLGGEAGMAGAGACAGFLCFNYPPARVFMGDSGSLLLGAAIVLLAAEKGFGSSFAWIAVPLIDAVFVVVRRIRQGRRPWIGGTDHLGHALLRMGVSSRALPALYGATALAIGLAFTVWQNP